MMITGYSTVIAQTFFRSELNTQVTTPWEIQYGPDNMLWLTEFGGKVSRVDPETGTKQVVYTAPDVYAGSSQEMNQPCGKPIGSGTLGLALHPEFTNPATPYIYFMYSYNAGNETAPDTRFKIRRLTWNSTSQSVTSAIDIVTGISNGYDHFGGRMMIISQNNVPYLFVTVGDHGLSELNAPTCYNPQSLNPNNFTQDPSTDNGKIHRFNLDGTIPADNPIPGNSFYTRGHRNPQGLMYDPNLQRIYDVEHGDRTDDEINILEKGMNYGWKNVRGYNLDDNFPGELDYVNNYVPDPQIANDHLVEPFYSFCAEPLPTTSNWCTVAPSDGLYYGSSGIPEWTNSLLITTLKDDEDNDLEVYQFKLDINGELVPSTPGNPNPKLFFGEDQHLNGRLRDIAASPDGKTIYLINNGGTSTDKIIVYTYSAVGLNEFGTIDFQAYPNPANDQLSIHSVQQEKMVCEIYTTSGSLVQSSVIGNGKGDLNIETLENGIYLVKVSSGIGSAVQMFVKSNH